MSKVGHRHRNHLTTLTNSWQKHEGSTIIDKLPVENQNEDALCFPIDFGKITIDGLIVTIALTSVISETHLQKVRLQAPQTKLNEAPPPDFHIKLANGYLETPSATVEIQFEVGNILFKEGFIVMTNPTTPIIGLLSLQRNSTNLVMRQGVLIFPCFSMQLKHANNTYSNFNEPLFNPTDIQIQPG